MAEFVVIYDSAAGSFISKQLGSAHLADAAVVSGKLGAGSVISGAIAAGAIGGAHLNANDVWPGRTFSGAVLAQTFLEFVGDGAAYDDGTRHMIGARSPAGGWGIHLGVRSGAALHSFFTMGGTAIMRVNSGNIETMPRFNGVDISAHTHGAGAGDAPNILSASIASGSIGPHIAAQGVLSAHIAANSLATPHFVNQGILSASIAANSLATPHFANQGILSASIGANALGTPHFVNQGILSASIGANVLATPHFANQGILSASIASGILGPHLASGGILSAHVGQRQISAQHLAYGAAPEFISSFILTTSGDYAIAIPSGLIQLKLYGTVFLYSGLQTQRIMMRFNGYTSGDYFSEIFGRGTATIEQNLVASGISLFGNIQASSGYPEAMSFDGAIAVPLISGWGSINAHWSMFMENGGFIRAGGRLRLQTSGLPSLLSGVTLHSPSAQYSGSVFSLWGIRR